MQMSKFNVYNDSNYIKNRGLLQFRIAYNWYEN